MKNLEAIADVQSWKKTLANTAWSGFDPDLALPNYRMPDYVLTY